MSAYYYIGCADCQIQLGEMVAITRLDGQHLDNQDKFLVFMLAHLNHKLIFFSEFNDEQFEWPVFK